MKNPWSIGFADPLWRYKGGNCQGTLKEPQRLRFFQIRWELLKTETCILTLGIDQCHQGLFFGWGEYCQTGKNYSETLERINIKDKRNIKV
jgi:hypothetical protein